jgi:hypothetical protein
MVSDREVAAQQRCHQSRSTSALDVVATLAP